MTKRDIHEIMEELKLTLDDVIDEITYYEKLFNK